MLVALVVWLLVKQDHLRTQDLDHTEKVVQAEQTLVAVVAEWQLVLVEVEQVVLASLLLHIPPNK